MAGVDDVLLASLQRAHRLYNEAVPSELLRVLREADDALKKRLARVARAAGGSIRFSEAQMMAYQAQIAVSVDYVKARLLGITHVQAEAAIVQSVRSTVRDLERLERAFSGVVTPLRLREAATMEGIMQRVSAALLNQHATSVDRYGEGMIRDFRKLMTKGIMRSVSASQMVDALVAHGGPRGPRVSLRARELQDGTVVRLQEEEIPEGLFVRKRYWAERVVRTEVAHGQNEARLRTIETSRNTDFPDMGKKILAVLDNRTALDSLGVHGQVRPVEGLFQDGAGRQYLRPPARPNDRETIVPWRLDWEETAYSRPLPAAELDRLRQEQALGGGEEHNQRVRAQKRADAGRLARKAQQANQRVHEKVGDQLARGIGAARTATQAAEVVAARAKARVATKEAKVAADEALRRARAKAAEKAQQMATAEGQASARRRRRAAEARAKARMYEQRAKAQGS